MKRNESTGMKPGASAGAVLVLGAAAGVAAGSEPYPTYPEFYTPQGRESPKNGTQGMKPST